MRPFDLTPFKKVIVEELCLLEPKKLLATIDQCLKYPDIQFLGNGDQDQNEMGEVPNAFKTREEFYDAVLPRLFTSIQVLKGSMRLQGPNKDRDVALELEMKADFKAGMSIRNAIKKYSAIENSIRTFTDLSFATGKKCIHLTNLAGMLRPCDTTRLKYKGYDRLKRLTRGVVYECEPGFDEEGRAIVVIEGTGYPRHHFANPEAMTGASAQGDTIDSEFCIFEAFHYYMSWKAFFTAVCRCTQLANVWIYVGKSTTANVVADIKNKIEGHKSEVKKVCREWLQGEYVERKWVCEHLKRNNACCYKCGDPMSFVAGDYKHWSINRKDNALAHTKANCEVICLSCNHAYRDRGGKGEEV